MVSLNRLVPLTLIILFSSCAKVGYVYDQGLRQISLLHKARSNSEILSDVRISSKHKEKIMKIEQYKQFFYNFWKRDQTKIYSKTTILENEAVTYLVIASPYDEIKAKKECFPFLGCFPYLGFFEKEKASEHAQNLQKEGVQGSRSP